MKGALAVAALVAAVVNGDMYMQCIRGSNNRLDEANRDRNNGNRLFDSQNNDRGGYNVGKMSYYVGEQVPICWTNQHGAGRYQMYGTEIIFQYACGTKMRDGTSTNRIPDRPNQCANFDCDTDVEYGRHESWTDYQYCKATSRNKGLFIANQNLRNRHAAIYTRQNPAGTRRGYECPEERDYYPYWRPSIWKDIVILTAQTGRCDAYQEESQNVKGRYACIYTDEYWDEILEGYVSNANGELPITEYECNQSPNFTVPSTNSSQRMYYWEYFDPWNIDAPECTSISATRANHHGLIGGRKYYTYEWTVPNDISEDSETCCVIRTRYNITTADYQAWESDESIHAGLDYKNNTWHVNGNPDPDDDPAWVKIWENFGLTYYDIYQSFNGDRDSNAQQKSRGYVFINNPRVDPFGWLFNGTGGTGYRIQLQLAINTNQFGRTFQDRTHCFQIKERPEDIDDSATIKLLTVQGKRGNIVQVYPATEYFFVPEPLVVSTGDYIHFCWTGSNTNPNNNDGQGKQGTDRSNICPLTQEQYDKTFYSDIDGNVGEFESGAVGDLGNNYPDYVQMPDYGLPDYYDYSNKRGVTPSDMAGFNIKILKALCLTRRIDENELLDYGNMEELDDAGTTFCIEPIMAEENGLWNFLCTRNNNFSNRSQKGTLQVANNNQNSYSISSDGYFSVATTPNSALIVVNSGVVDEGESLELDVTTWTNEGEESTIVEITGLDNALDDDEWIELWIPYTPKSLSVPYAKYRATTDDDWTTHGKGAIEYSSEVDTFYAVININSSGFYQAYNMIDWGLVLIGGVMLIAIIGVAGMALITKCKS